MANRNDVVLTIKANDLGTPTLEKLKTLLGQVTTAQEALAKSSGNADEAIAELTKQQEALVEATKPLAGLQAIAQRLLGTGQEIAAKKAQVAGLRQQIKGLTSDIDAAGGKGTAAQNSALRRLESDAKRAQAQFEKLKQTASDLAGKLDAAGLGRNGAGALRQINTVGGASLSAQASVPQQIADIARLKQAEAEVTAEVQRRADAEARLAAIRKAEEQRQIADAVRISNKRAGAISAFSTLPDESSVKALNYQKEITAEVQRRAEIQARADDAEKSALDQQINDYVRLSRMREDAMYAFSNMPSASEAAARNQAPLRVASANESAMLRRQKAALDAAAAAKTAAKEEASAAQQAASVFVQASDREIAAAAKKAAAMRAAGATTEQILAQSKQIAGSASAYQKLGLSFDEVGQKVGKAAKGFSLFRDEGRTTLSLTQRIRGEVLSLASAYLGVYAAVDQFNKVVQAAKTEQAVKAQLTLVVGNDPEKVAKQYAFLRAEADRVGQSFETVSEGYAKVAIAAQKYGLTQAEVNKQFSDLLTVSRAQGISSDQLSQANLALQQIFDFGKLRAQEFNQIINSGINGLGQALAKVVPEAEGSVAKLRKIMETTGVPARALALALDEVAKQSLPAFIQQMKGADAAQNVFQNSVGDLRRAFADSGFIQAFAKALRDLTDRFKDPQFKQSVAELGSKFGTLLTDVVALATKTNLLSTILVALSGFAISKIISSTINLVSQFTALKAAVIETTAAFKAGEIGAVAFGTSMLSAFAPVIGIAIAGVITLISSLNQKLEEGARKADEMRKRIISLNAPDAEIRAGAQARTKSDLQDLYVQIEDYKQQIAQARKDLADAQKQAYDIAAAPDYTGGGAALGGVAIVNAAQKKLDDLTAKLDEAKKLQGTLTKALNASIGGSASPSGDTITSDQQQKLKEDQRTNDAAAFSKKLVDIQTALNEKKGESDKNYFEKYKAQYHELVQMAEDYEKKYGDKGPRVAVEAYLKQLAAIDNAKGGTSASKKADEMLRQLGTQLSRVVEEVKAGQKAIVLSSSAEINAYLDKQSAAIAQKYALLIDKIKALKPGQKIDIGDGQQLSREQALEAANSAKAIEEATARTAAYTTAINQQKEETSRLEQAQAAEIEAVNAKVQVGLESEYQGKVEILKIQDKYRASILDSVEKTKQLLVALRDGTDADKDLFKKLGGDALLAQLDAIQIKTAQVQTIWTEAFKKFKTDLAGGATDAIITFGKGLAGVITGANSLGQAFQGALKSFREFAANFLEQIAQMILQTIILKALQSTFGGSFGLSGGGSGGSLHSGGMVSAPTTSKPIMSSWFIGAPRYHTGGIVGLKPNEVPIIAKRGEEVLSEGDPRNALNGGRGGMGPAAAPNVKIINTIDSESFVSQGLATEGGVRALLNVMRAHQNTVKNTLGIR